jgi:tRNA G10  N-methylase Trm11
MTVNHPAVFSKEVISSLLIHSQKRLDKASLVLDPFAGTGGIHSLCPPYKTIGVEIEKEWADQHERNICADSTKLTKIFKDQKFDAIITSPPYGNRMSDQYQGDAKNSKRYTYRISLGRDLADTNTAKFNWGNKYKLLHQQIWNECYKVLNEDGYLFLNISNHIRAGKEESVVEWHVSTLIDIGFYIDEIVSIDTKRIKHGSNSALRADSEKLAIFKKISP